MISKMHIHSTYNYSNSSLMLIRGSYSASKSSQFIDLHLISTNSILFLKFSSCFTTFFQVTVPCRMQRTTVCSEWHHMVPVKHTLHKLSHVWFACVCGVVVCVWCGCICGVIVCKCVV